MVRRLERGSLTGSSGRLPSSTSWACSTRQSESVAAHPTIAPGAVLFHRPEWSKAILLPGVNVVEPVKLSGFQLTEAGTYGLYTLAQLIDQLPEVTQDVSKSEIDKLASAVADLRNSIVEATDLDQDLKTFLFDQVTKMQQRIDAVRITGTGPVEDLVAETIGSGAVQSSEWRRAMDSSVRERIVRVFIAFQAIVGTVDTTTAAIESASGHVSGAVTIIEQIFADPPKQLGAPKPPLQLPPSPGEQQGDNNAAPD